MSLSNIRYIRHKDLNKTKWDECIQQSLQSIIYAESAYLDIMAGEWDALVMGDYETVMPLTHRSKLGIKYLYQPAFVQQGGVFSRYPIEYDMIELFLHECQIRFQFAEVHFNFGNSGITTFKEKAKTIAKNNFLLNLNLSYEIIKDQYHPYFKRRINIAENWPLLYESEDYVGLFIDSFRQLYQSRMKQVKSKEWENLRLLCAYYQQQNRLFVRSVTDSNTKEKLASVILLTDQNRIYNLIPFITTNGRKKQANYFLYNNIISEFAGKQLILDFEGSDIPGVANFYKKIAKENQSYYFLRYNHLPFFIRWIKEKKTEGF